MYEVLNLPEAFSDGIHLVQYAGLPDFLAASADGDRYLELARQDVTECTKSHSKVCRFRTPIAKGDAKKSCVLALFKKDEPAQNNLCKAEIGEWKGSKVISLDQRRWALSDVKEQDLLIACPKIRTSKPDEEATQDWSIQNPDGMRGEDQ